MGACRCATVSGGKHRGERELLEQGLAMKWEVPTWLDVSLCTVRFAARIRYRAAVVRQVRMADFAVSLFEL